MIEAVQGDITTLKVDAIVNAANQALGPGSGVNGAIREAAGLGLAAECSALGGCPVGEARITGGYLLPARYVIHTVGPVWQGGGASEAKLLGSCYLNSLRTAAENGLESIAFPCISTGIFGYPPEPAAAIAVAAARSFQGKNPLPRRIIFCCFSKEDLAIYRKLLKRRRRNRK